jgi:septum formation protein
MNKKLILASQSPRRQALLTQLGYQFEIIVSDIDESLKPDELPADYVLRLAKEKALHAFALSDNKVNSLVLGSDTSVVCQGQVLGKPENEADSIKMLSLLSGNQHQVLTAIAVVGQEQGIEQVFTKLVTTEVYFKALTLTEMQQYWQTGEPQDKAGSYAIQGIAGQFIKSIQGSYSAVVGLPLYECAQLLTEAGMAPSISVST